MLRHFTGSSLQLKWLICWSDYRNLKAVQRKLSSIFYLNIQKKYQTILFSSTYSNRWEYMIGINTNVSSPLIDRSGAYCFCPVCLPVCLSTLLVFNIRYNFWTVRDKWLHIWHAQFSRKLTSPTPEATRLLVGLVKSCLINYIQWASKICLWASGS